MNVVALRNGGEVVAARDMARGLPAMVDRASHALALAVGPAEILEAKAMANVVYDAAKAAARFAKAKGAFDEIMAAVYRAQADALEIEAEAKRRLADEVDAAQARGELATKGGNGNNQSVGNAPAKDISKFSDVGLNSKRVWEFRQIRDAEDKSPGIVRESLNRLVLGGVEPTRTALGREINTRLGSFSGDNEWYTPTRYIEMARDVMGSIDVDPASNAIAQETVKAETFYTDADSGLEKEWNGTVWLNPPYSNPEVQQFAEKVIAECKAGRTTEAIVLTNNSADTAWHRRLQDECARMCTTTGRIRFESPTRQGNSPAMGQSFFYFGDDPERFKDVFSAIGNVWRLA